MTVNRYLEQLIENGAITENQIVAVYDKKNNLVFLGKAGFAPLNLYYELERVERVGNELHINERFAMNEKVLAKFQPSPFTTHYTVRRSDGSLDVRTVHTCPCCGTRRLIIWSDENSLLFADIVFGFRKCKSGFNTEYGNIHVQSYCRNCRSHLMKSGHAIKSGE